MEKLIAKDLLSIKAVFLRPEEPFTWASGIKSPVYCDNRLTFTAPKVRCDVENAFAELIKTKYPDCAVTLSVGEKSRDEYKALKSAGADRYLLRHETANDAHYRRLHPQELSLKNRKQCLYDLKDLGFQVGAGFMVGSPYQTAENLAEDLIFLRELQPHMVGIGPFIAQHDSVFKDFPNGTLNLTLTMLALVRILLPRVLLPATTALGSIVPDGRERGFLAGANVVMPNLSPTEHRGDYSLYDNKLHSGAESASGLKELQKRTESVKMTLDMGIGHSLVK